MNTAGGCPAGQTGARHHPKPSWSTGRSNSPPPAIRSGKTTSASSASTPGRSSRTLAGVEPEIEKHLVGPHPELGELDDGLEAGLADAHAELQEPLFELVDGGLPIPRVGYDLGEPNVGIGELVWEDRKLAVTLDLPEEDLAQLRAAGYRVVNFDTTDPVWVDACMARLTELFELGRDPAESANQSPGDGEDADNDDE